MKWLVHMKANARTTQYEVISRTGAAARLIHALQSMNFGAISMGVFCLLLVFSVFNESKLSLLASASVMVVWTLFTILWRPTLLFKYLPFYLGVGMNLIGVISCEMRKAMLPELQVCSGFHGSFPLLVLAHFIFLFLVAVLDSTLLVRKIESSENGHIGNILWTKVFESIFYCSCSLIIIAYLHVVSHPSFLLGVDRFAYSQEYLQGIWNVINKVLPFLAVLILVEIVGRHKRVAVFTLTIYVLYLFWTGNKFGAFISLITNAALVSYHCIIGLDKKTMIRFSAIIIGSVLLLVPISAMVYSAASNKSPVDFIMDRTAQQGQLWWSIFDKCAGSVHPEEFSNEIDALFNYTPTSENVGAQHGIYKMMYLTAPVGMVDYRLSSGVRYTEAGYAASYYYLGAVGVAAFSVIKALLVFFVTHASVRALKERRPIGIVACFRYIIIVQEVSSMFIFGGLVSKTSILCLILCICEAFIYRKTNPTEEIDKLGCTDVDPLM